MADVRPLLLVLLSAFRMHVGAGLGGVEVWVLASCLSLQKTPAKLPCAHLYPLCIPLMVQDWSQCAPGACAILCFGRAGVSLSQPATSRCNTFLLTFKDPP